MITDKSNDIPVLKSCQVPTEIEQATIPLQNKLDASIKIALKSSTETDLDTKNKVLPAFIDPLNREAFEERVITFKPQWWPRKPVELSPRYIARYGWRCASKDILQCTFCKSHISSHLPAASKVKLYRQCLDILLDKISSGHRSGCPWAVRPSSEQFTAISDEDKTWKQFVECVNDLNTLGDNLPDIVAELPTDLQEICAVLLQGIPNLTDHRCLILAVCGWRKQNKPTSKLTALVCLHCNRNVGCWNFKPSTCVLADNLREQQDNSQFDYNIASQSEMVENVHIEASMLDAKEQSEPNVNLITTDSATLSEFLVFDNPVINVNEEEDLTGLVESHLGNEMVVQNISETSLKPDEGNVVVEIINDCFDVNQGNTAACFMQYSCKADEESSIAKSQDISEFNVYDYNSNSSGGLEGQEERLDGIKGNVGSNQMTKDCLEIGELPENMTENLSSQDSKVVDEVVNQGIEILQKELEDDSHAAIDLKKEMQNSEVEHAVDNLQTKFVPDERNNDNMEVDTVESIDSLTKHSNAGDISSNELNTTQVDVSNGTGVEACQIKSVESKDTNVEALKRNAETKTEVKRRNLALIFHPLQQHWNWCPWVLEQNFEEQNIKGWQLNAFQLIENYNKFCSETEIGGWKNNPRFSSVVYGLRSIQELLDT